MDIGSVMHAMRDQAGIPAIPALFQFLMVFTWIFHIAFVTLTLGAAALSIYAFYGHANNADWQRLSIALTKVAKVGVSLLIVLGVAPLLFTQVIYDPQWYAANVLSARWVIGFIASLIVAYCLWFAFYWGNHEGAKRHIGVYAILGLLLFLMDGLIMHVLSYQAIQPQRWMDWYAPGGVVDTSGGTLHAIEWPRYLFIISLSIPAIGVFLVAYTDYFADRADKPKSYLAFVRKLGRRLGLWGFLISTPLLIWWHFDHPPETHLASQPVGWLMVIALLVMANVMRDAKGNVHGYALIGLGVGVLAMLAVWREIVRATYLKPFGYVISDYKVNVDWPSLFLFFATLVGVGGLVGGYYVTLLYQSGKVAGRYEANGTVAKLGTGAVAVLAVWIAVFFAYGAAIYIRNALV
ncbi:hypothetical protein [Methyloferula stellata]|uniref:hypothetical protein n=1 Tax=Methyloferula stellata TaxID=876270 RepID=UPI00036A11CE|nr:hypothetical protein [Methyloferula stellata]